MNNFKLRIHHRIDKIFFLNVSSMRSTISKHFSQYLSLSPRSLLFSGETRGTHALETRLQDFIWSRGIFWSVYSFSAKTESKLAKVSVTIVFVFLFCWTPYVVTRTLAFMGLRLSSVVMSSAVWFLHASSFVNPIIYSSLRSDFQNALWSTLKKTRVQRAPAAVLSQNVASDFGKSKNCANVHWMLYFTMHSKTMTFPSTEPGSSLH